MKKPLLKISALAKKAARRFEDAETKAFRRMLLRWKKEDAERQFRTNYPGLDKASIVIDLGGYQGQWASDIYAIYGCTVHVFEPLPDYAKKINARFALNENIYVNAFGLGARNERVHFSVAGDSTSLFVEGGNKVEVEIKEATTYFVERGIDRIDLMKINIEGGEYELLEHLLAKDAVKNIVDLQIQFHHFVPGAEARMKAIKTGLSATHELTYEFPFLWENWRRK